MKMTLRKSLYRLEMDKKKANLHLPVSAQCLHTFLIPEHKKCIVQTVKKTCEVNILLP